MAEAIPDQDLVSRLVDSPFRWSAAERRFVDRNLFEFTSEAPFESVVWRKYAVDIVDVHRLGCELQARKRRPEKPDWTYEGAITASVSAVRAIRSQVGDRFTVEHAPEEGIHHAHVAYGFVDGTANLKQRKSDLKERLRNVFLAGEFAQHECR